MKASVVLIVDAVTRITKNTGEEIIFFEAFSVKQRALRVTLRERTAFSNDYKLGPYNGISTYGHAEPEGVTAFSKEWTKLHVALSSFMIYNPHRKKE
jgi:hypothetical protein